MKDLKFLLKTLVIVATTLVLTSCGQEDYEFGDIVTPTNLEITAQIVGQDANNPFGDGSGEVVFTASADNAITYLYTHNGSEQITPSGVRSIIFSELGVNTYTVTVVAYGTGGNSTSRSIEVEVFASYSPPADLITMLTGDSEREWRIKAESPGHYGVGPVEETSPIWWAAGPYDKDGLGSYDDRLIFNVDGSITYVTNGNVYGKGTPLEQDFGISWPMNSDNEFENYPIDDFTDQWVLTAPGGQETLTFLGNGFHTFYVGGDHSYQILERSDNEMMLKTIGSDGLAWFAILTAEAEQSNGFESNYNNLIWADEFDTNGAPDSANWTYDLGAGGWGNQEEQTYTSDAANVIVEDGSLKITAINTGSSYTSARIKTQGLFDFTYGRIEARAKLPASSGTWPAIWALGSNFDTVGWPDCGEIDVMEHAGNNLNTIHGTLHYPGNSGGNGNGGTTTVGTATTDFHLYTVEWSPDEILFVVDDTVVYHTFVNDNTTPFNNDFFLIINLAMGGTFGGTIDPGFTQDTLEVDYIRVFQ